MIVTEECRCVATDRGLDMGGCEQHVSPRQEQPEGEWKPIQQRPAAVAADDGDLVDLPF